MICLVTGRPETYDWDELEEQGVTSGNFDEFVHWTFRRHEYQFDTETTMTERGPNAHQLRKLLVLQLSDLIGGVRWVFDWTHLPEKWEKFIRRLLISKLNCFYIHNSSFDYSVVQANMGIKISNMHDTFLMSKVLNTGLTLHKGYHSLAECLARFLNVYISKDQQTTFTEAPMTTAQVLYAAEDVVHMGNLFKELKKLLLSWNLWDVYNTVEREVVKVYCDMEFNPMGFDYAYWQTLAKTFIVEKDKILANMNKLVSTMDAKLLKKLKDPNNDIELALVQPTDEYFINWNSSAQRTKLLGLLIPKLPLTLKRKPEIKQWFKDNEDSLNEEEIEVLTYYMTRKYDDLNAILISKHQRWLQKNGLFKNEGDILINWNSTVHKLFIFNHFYPNLSDTNAKSLARIHKNPLINEFKKYTKVQKDVSSYGEGFLTKYVREDGMIAPFGFNQLLTTGRVSFGILLQIPGTAKFRNAFLPPFKNWVFVDTDYSSAEVAIMSFAAGETAFLDAIKQGKDLHCMSASLIFSDKWDDVAEPGCQHLIDGSRCDCKEHEKLRKFSKAITFGLAYGLTHHGLADRLDISKTDAKTLIDKFFNTFTKLKGFFKKNGDSGVKDRYIRGLAPTNRIRFFAYPEHSGDEDAIERAAKNFVIQEANASVLKIALINLRKRIINENLPVILHLPIHDEILASCPKDFAEEYLKIQEEEMIKAADQFLEPGLLGVDSEILEIWTK